MAETTTAGVIHQTIFGILDAGRSRLAVGGRAVTIYKHFPEHEFSQRSLPALVVERPTVDEENPWGGNYVRRDYTVPMLLVDACGVRPGDEHAVMESIELMTERVRAEFSRPENANLRMAFLHVFWSLCRMDEQEVRVGGNNLYIRPVDLTVPVTVERGKTWDV